MAYELSQRKIEGKAQIGAIPLQGLWSGCQKEARRLRTQEGQEEERCSRVEEDQDELSLARETSAHAPGRGHLSASLFPYGNSGAKVLALEPRGLRVYPCSGAEPTLRIKL